MICRNEDDRKSDDCRPVNLSVVEFPVNNEFGVFVFFVFLSSASLAEELCSTELVINYRSLNQIPVLDNLIKGPSELYRSMVKASDRERWNFLASLSVDYSYFLSFFCSCDLLTPASCGFLT